MNQFLSFFNDDYTVENKPFFKRWIDKLVNIIDNGKIFRKPPTYFYRFFGIVCMFFAIFIAVIPFCERPTSNFEYVVWGLAHSITCNYFNAFIFLLVTLSAGSFNLLFWINRSNKLRSRVPTGSDIVVIPVVADILQSFLEWIGYTIMLFVPIYSIYYGIFGQLFEAYSANGSFPDFDTYKSIFIFKIFFSIGAVIGGYIIITLGHFFGENIKAIATITNNVRDLGDIHRAVTMNTDISQAEQQPTTSNTKEI